MSAPSAAPRERLRALDWLRGIAVLVMAECHVFNALLAPEYRSSSWFGFLNWLNGFVAPAFLLVSGAVMGINLQNRWGKGTGKMWRRVGQVFLVAYLLHLPTPLLWQFFGPRGPHLVELWTKMDILQCVAGSLAIILLLVPVARTPQMHRILCAALGIIAATSAVPVTKWVASGVEIPKPILNYLWPTGIGIFPLVPWAGFPLIGLMLGPAISSEASRPRQCLRAVLAGIVMLVASKFMRQGLSYDAPFVFARMGWILLALGGCVWLDAPVKGTGWILQFGELSLWSYTVHLIIVYGSCVSLGLDSLHPRFSPVVAFTALAVVLLITASVVNWRAKNLQRRAALRMMPAQ
jgi:uncharacterized membrane protein